MSQVSTRLIDRCYSDFVATVNDDIYIPRQNFDQCDAETPGTDDTDCIHVSGFISWILFFIFLLLYCLLLFHGFFQFSLKSALLFGFAFLFEEFGPDFIFVKNIIFCDDSL